MHPYKQRSKDKWLSRQYGVSLTAYETMRLKQKNRCAICNVLFDELSKEPAVDHDHRTGAIRELLCCHCNLGLGSFFDDPVKLRAAAVYLEKHSIVSDDASLVPAREAPPDHSIAAANATMDTKVADLGLSARALNRLYVLDILTVEDITRVRSAEIYGTLGKNTKLRAELESVVEPIKKRFWAVSRLKKVNYEATGNDNGPQANGDRTDATRLQQDQDLRK